MNYEQAKEWFAVEAAKVCVHLQQRPWVAIDLACQGVDTDDLLAAFDELRRSHDGLSET